MSTLVSEVDTRAISLSKDIPHVLTDVDSHCDEYAPRSAGKSRSISSSFSDLGDLEDFNETSGNSASFSPIHEEQTTDEKEKELKRSNSFTDCIIDLIEGEVLQLQVENTAYVVFYQEEAKENVENGEEVSMNDVANDQRIEQERIKENSDKMEDKSKISKNERNKITSSSISSTSSISENHKSKVEKTIHRSFAGLDAAGHKVVTVNRYHSSNASSNTTTNASSDYSTFDATRSLGRGLFRASTYVGSSLLKGATGLVQETYEGGTNGGLFGFARGLGIGMIGLGTHAVKGAVRGVGQVTNVVGEMVLGIAPHISLDGSLVCTNYRIVWISRTSKDRIEIPLASIANIENATTAPHILNIECKHLLHATFALEDEQLCCQLIETVYSMYSLSYTFATYHNESNVEKNFLYYVEEEEWLDLDPFQCDIKEDYERIGLLNNEPINLNEHVINISMRLLDNTTFEQFPSYPSQFVVPMDLTMNEIEEIAQYRSSRRIPAVVWKHPSMHSYICRCAQPRVGLSGFTSQADQKNVALLQRSNAFHFIDARSQIAAAANYAQGKGTEDVRNYPNSQLHYCDMANIHAVRSSYTYLRALCQPGIPFHGSQWKEQLQATGWMQLLAQMLSAVQLCTTFLNQGESIMIHCSDGWDRTPQLTALTQLCLDPFYRTMRGFFILIEKEWISFGHLFRSRYSHGECPGHQETGEQSPVFIQFLENVWNLWKWNRWAFEFSEDLLELLYVHCFSCLYGTFLYNSMKERWEKENDSSTRSLWSFVYHLFRRTGKYRNELYNELDNLQAIGRSLNIESTTFETMELWHAHQACADPICKKYE